MTCIIPYISKLVGFKIPKTEEEYQGSGDNNVQTYTYKDLMKITDNFSYSNKIGQGGFGSVYKAKLRDGTIVAVKVLSSESSRESSRDFLNELNIISKIDHENLVKFCGCCVEGNHRILVHKYVENNNLAQTLLGGGYSNIQFNWAKRMNICIGIARGLEYLHETVRPHIVHRDIKASNILLDKDLNPQISDFGLAKLLPADMTEVSTRVAGTMGYLAPEYALRGQLTRRADVYSFGVLLLEIVTGRCNTNRMLPNEDCYLLERAWMAYENDNIISIVDVFLNDNFDENQALQCVKIGLLCTQESPQQRPKMSDVVKMLAGKKAVVMDGITKPGLISDFTKLKIKNQKSDEVKSSSSISSRGNSSFCSTFKSDQDE